MKVTKIPSLCFSAMYNLISLTNSRFHNGTLLEKSVYHYDETLVLRNLRMDQAGEYYCRASGENGAIKSKPATLSVIGELYYITAAWLFFFGTR